MRTDPGDSRRLDDCFARDYARNIGAEVMGRNKFGPQRGPGTTTSGAAGGVGNPVPYRRRSRR
jgi:hypothetical protein